MVGPMGDPIGEGPPGANFFVCHICFVFAYVKHYIKRRDAVNGLAVARQKCHSRGILVVSVLADCGYYNTSAFDVTGTTVWQAKTCRTSCTPYNSPDIAFRTYPKARGRRPQSKKSRSQIPQTRLCQN